MRLIDADKLIESMDKRYNEKKDIVSDTLAEGFMQMDKLIREQDVFDLSDHDKQIRDEVIDECKEILAEFCENNEKSVPVKVVKRLNKMKGKQNG